MNEEYDIEKIKVFYSCVYIVIVLLRAKIDQKFIDADLLNRIKPTSFINKLTHFSVITFLYIFEFWLLTEVSITTFQNSFPFWLLLTLISFYLIAESIHALLRGFYGISSEGKRYKVGLICLFMNVYQRLTSTWMTLLSGMENAFLKSACAIGALLVFWTLPLHNEKVLLWGIIFIFIIPAIGRIITILVNLTPTLISEYIDDDVRIGVLCNSFAGILHSMILFIFPFITYGELLAEEFPWLPKVWMLVLVPFLFFFAGVIPFVHGVNKYKNQLKDFLLFRREWLEKFKYTFTITVKNNIINTQREEIEHLDTMINEHLAQNRIKEVYLDIRKHSLGNDRYTSAIRPKYSILLKERKYIEDLNLQLSFVNKLKELKKNISNSVNQKNLERYVDMGLVAVQKEIDNFDKSYSGKNSINIILKSLVLPSISALIVKFTDYFSSHYLEIIIFLKKFQ